ncbi:MAG: cysteine desulfurase NifS [Candidatus Yanofskybacteria bacterium CG10_big_fil_rev_8_21_14_0_10_46_23]|uniref:Cysteine desulfurase NifS n=1 Tax=Candidatus Yanofskybacteria bacterium CG10_big_fil_rev_8_21_14_0_10_46_23 TaxID=1975098 RepID=A0A2H0R4C8_9BACT|nr:MAG: cysteine desulfurase NifS [Candidatus Yanofskybacteria bacterium CG10_big_fil_rev_8_21_14_0_10_46_23]
MSLYLDYAATTPLDGGVKKEMARAEAVFANPASFHEAGRKARDLLDGARQSIAQILSVKTEEIIFTGSGTESINLAILGVARANRNFGNHIVTTNIEHFAVLKSCQQLEREGFEITYVPAEKNGIVDSARLERSLKKETILVSVMQANNEIGTLQPIRRLGQMLQDMRRETGQRYPYFHTDACQATGALNINPHSLNVDLLSFNGSKIYGPKGVGALFVRRGLHLQPIIFGGSQERGLRAGTESVVLAIGLATALKITYARQEQDGSTLSKLRDEAIKEILETIHFSELNGHPQKRLPNNLNISFKHVEGEMLTTYLSDRGIYVSTGSACTTTATGPSHVIRALGVNTREWGNIRITLGRETTKWDLKKLVKNLETGVNYLRRLKK